MAPTLMWIGLGNMGRGMAKNLVEKGSLAHPLIVHNRTQQRAQEFAATLPAGKTQVVDSVPAGVQRADLIFTCLSNDQAVEDSYAAIAQLGAKALRGKTFVDCSTVAPEASERVGALLTALGGDVEFVASPVFGAPAAADSGQLIFVPAGPKAAIDRLRPFIKGVMGRAEVPFEDAPHGTSSKLKLIGNTFVMNMVTQLAEGFTVAEKSGVGVLPLKQLVDLLLGGAYSAYGDRMLQGTYWKMQEPLFSANNAIKDLNHAINLAEASGVELSNAKTALGYVQEVAEHAGGDRGDIAGIYGATRKRAGLKFENDT